MGVRVTHELQGGPTIGRIHKSYKRAIGAAYPVVKFDYTKFGMWITPISHPYHILISIRETKAVAW